MPVTQWNWNDSPTDLLRRIVDNIAEGGGGGGEVSSVNGQTGDVVLDAADVGAAERSISFVVSGGGVPLVTGVQDLILNAKAAGTITAWSVTASPADTITFDILRSADGGAAPSASIVGGGTKPNLASGVNAHSTNFSGWTSTAISSYDNFKFQITAVGGVCTSATITIYY